jgi:hypothetical protein
MTAMKILKMGTTRKSAPRPTQQLMEEIFFEILARLPVKSLLRFRLLNLLAGVVAAL